MSWFKAVMFGVAVIKNAGTALTRSAYVNCKDGVKAVFNTATNEIDVSLAAVLDMTDRRLTNLHDFGGTAVSVGTGSSKQTVATVSNTGDAWVADGKTVDFGLKIWVKDSGGTYSTKDELQFQVYRNGATYSTATYTLINKESSVTSTTSLTGTLTNSGVGYEITVASGVLTIKVDEDGSTARTVECKGYYDDQSVL